MVIAAVINLEGWAYVMTCGKLLKGEVFPLHKERELLNAQLPVFQFGVYKSMHVPMQ